MPSTSVFITQSFSGYSQFITLPTHEVETRLLQLSASDLETFVGIVNKIITQGIVAASGTPHRQESTDQEQLEAPAIPLSSREENIIDLLAKGYSYKQIGEALFISPFTVNNHCANMREKLGIKGRNALIAYAFTCKNR